MDWKEIKLENKEEIDRFLKGRFITSDLNFTNIFLWSLSEKNSFKIENDILYIKAIYEKEEYFFPPVPLVVEKEKLIEGFENIPKNKKVVFIPEIYKTLLENRYNFKEERDSFDYIYLQKDLAELKGRKYASKKNKINRFQKTYEYTYEKISENNIKDVIEFQENWVKKREEQIVISENKGIIEILLNYHRFNLRGGLIRVCGRVIAYAFGEKLDDDMAVIHIEKADVEYIGVYQMINMLLAKEEFSDVLRINREDDFGSLGLREAKMSYMPNELLKKYSFIRE